MVLHKLLDIDQIGCYMAHRLSQTWVVEVVHGLFEELGDVLVSKSTINDVAIFVHRSHVLLHVVCARP